MNAMPSVFFYQSQTYYMYVDWISKSQEYMMKECVLQESMMEEFGIVTCPKITAMHKTMVLWI